MEYRSVRVRRGNEATFRFLFVKIDTSSSRAPVPKQARRGASSSGSTSGDSESNAETAGGDRHVLFVTNLGTDITEDELADAYSAAGRVAGVALAALAEEDPSLARIRIARITFLTRGELAEALAVTELTLPALADDERPVLPSGYWLSLYQRARPPIAALQAQVDAFMERFDAAQAAEAAAKQARLNSTDADGWTVVARGGRKNRVRAADEEGTVVGTAAARTVGEDGEGHQRGKARRMRKKKAEAAPLDFYRFQRRNQKRDEIAALRGRFEEDRRRVAQMRADSQFAASAGAGHPMLLE